MTQPEPTQDDPQFDPTLESAKQDAQQQVGDSQQIWQGDTNNQQRGNQQPVTPPATPQPLSPDDIQQMTEQGDQSDVSQQQIDAAMGTVDDTVAKTVRISALVAL